MPAFIEINFQNERADHNRTWREERETKRLKSVPCSFPFCFSFFLKAFLFLYICQLFYRAMRNKIFISLVTTSLLLVCSVSQAQLATPPGPDLQEKAAGFELVKATKHFYTGTVLECGGGVVLLIGSAEVTGGNANGGSTLILLGGLAMITGTIFTIESYAHIGRAGKILMQRNDMTFGPTPNGMGLVARF